MVNNLRQISLIGSQETLFPDSVLRTTGTPGHLLDHLSVLIDIDESWPIQ